MEPDWKALPFEGDEYHWYDELMEVCFGGNAHQWGLKYLHMETHNRETHWEDVRTYVEDDEGNIWYINWMRGRGKHAEDCFDPALVFVGDERKQCLQLHPAVAEEVTITKYKPA